MSKDFYSDENFKRMKKLLRYIDLHLDEQLDNALLCSVA